VIFIKVRSRDLKKIILSFTLIFISLSFFGREHHFYPAKFLKEVEVDGHVYRVVSLDQIKKKNRQNLHNKAITPQKRNNKSKPLVVLNSKGKLIRDIPTLQKVFFTGIYSQLSPQDIREITSPLSLVDKEISSAISREGLSGRTYINNLFLMEYLIHKDFPFQESLADTTQKSKLIDFIDKILRDPDSGFLLMIREIMTQSKVLSQQGIKRFQAMEDTVLSFEEAQEIEGFRQALAYGSASCDFLGAVKQIKKQRLSQAKIKSKAILNQFSPSGLKAILKEKPVKNLILFAKDVIQIVYGEEQLYRRFLHFIKDGRTKIIRNIRDYLPQARYSAFIVPFYKSNYSDYPVPSKVKERYPHTLFHDNFSGSLNRWHFYGSGKPSQADRVLKIGSNGWYYSGASSRVLFNPRGGDVHLEILARLGQGKGSFGFGEKLIGAGGKKGIIPKLGFLFNQDIDGSGSVDFKINQELVETQFRLMLNLRKDHSFKLVLSKDNGVSFFIDHKKVYENPYKGSSYGSESVVFSSKSDDYLWKEILVQQLPN
ncbi:MAG: hypothetical protein OEZ36_10745, partial [Spirochaetota bacterium]|nr:hypothetical protein [Spirochaetota bacterium]